MPAPTDHIRELVRRPRESLNVELKDWLNPDVDRDAAKIVKGCIALRNQNGGFMLVGFDDATRAPSGRTPPPNVRELYHPDKIQRLISKYASARFEVFVHFAERDGRERPVIEIESGVKSPVATCRYLQVEGDKLIREHAVYVRSLEANNTVSTTEARAEDWPRIVEICFDNREADIGRFLRRHLFGASPERLGELAHLFSRAAEPNQTDEEVASQLLDDGWSHFEIRNEERSLQLPPCGTSEVGCTIAGEVPAQGPTRPFLDRLMASNPELTGWPVWIDPRNLRDDGSRPYVRENAWEALIWSAGGNWFNATLDFWRLDPAGRFYVMRGFQDDFRTESPSLEPGTLMDFALPVLRLAEALVVAKAFAKALDCDPDATQLVFAFRWRGLRGRQLASWANPGRTFSAVRRVAVQDQVVSHARLPLDTPDSALATVVHSATQSLFSVFDGFELGMGVVEDLVRRLIERRL